MRVASVKTTAAYLLLLIMTVLAFWAVNSAAALWAVLLVVAFGVFCFLDSALMARFSRLSFDLVRTRDEQNPLQLVACLQAPMLVVPCVIEADLVINNRLFGTETHTTLRLRSAGRKLQTFTYQYPDFACGKVDVRIDQVRYYDAFGFTFAHRELSFKDSLLVYPHPVSMKVAFERSPQSAYSGVTFDLFKRGVDRSETLDIRQYRQGDDPREVHWKLSAKMGELFVREPSRPTDYNVAILFGLGRYFTPEASVHGEAAAPVPVDVSTLDRAVALFASLSEEMVRGGVGHEACLPDGDRLRKHTVDTRNGWGNMLDTVLSMPLSHYSGDSVELFTKDDTCSIFTKIVYVTTEVNEGMLHRLSELADVTVFVVGDVSLSRNESMANCDIISLAPDQLEGRVETLSV